MEHQLATKQNISVKNRDQIRQYLTTGCDERIHLNELGYTRYWVNPANYSNLVHRGSCTCGTLNDDNVQVMDKLLASNLNDKESYESLLDEQTEELKKLINYRGEDKIEVFYGPSGSDLVYLPTLFCKILEPNRPVLNILSCPEELGSGTLHAVKGEYHADFNQFEESVSKGEKIDANLDIKVLSLTARGTDGKIVNHEKYIKEQIEKHHDHSIIVSLVYGSKSGIEDNLDIIDKIDQNNIIWTVDMCQFRHSKKIIHKLLDKNGCVLITGSKFYQAPPFCGALLVNKSFLNRLEQGDLQQFSRLKTIFSSYDFPSSIRKEVNLEPKLNIGLRLRWACSINEIQKFRKYPQGPVRKKINQWNEFIINLLHQSEAFEPMPDQSVTNKTIISFRVKKDGQYLNHQELKELFKSVVCDGRLASYNDQKIFIGQPVAYGQKSFLRLAIGSMCIREFIDNDENEFKQDASILNIIQSKTELLGENN